MSLVSKVKGKLGFGCMRFPMKDGEVDTETLSAMIDEYFAAGFNYFDTAHGYLNGKSETALCECLVKRYPRDSYILVNKLSAPFFKSREDIRPFFESQLSLCGVDYFDVYLMHAQDALLYERYKAHGAYEIALELKAEGKIKHFGISFHDKAAVLDRILAENPEIELVQIQFNYADYENPSVESKKCYEVCRKYGKLVSVMEPVKGGALANLPSDAQKIIASLGGGSAASLAIRFAAGFDGVLTVLSGMGSLEMMRDNVSYMKSPRPLDERENTAIGEVLAVLHSLDTIDCTACRYCTPVCPMKIPIPDLFACMNGKKLFEGWNADYYYEIHTQSGGLASSCIYCSRCEKHCPQHLKIPELLKKVADTFEKKEK
ncbi:MAG: aldo/keto reductase [Clostridia bacterium]|nr:aldo/keto reductase [Clostridia bacterium]